MSLPILCHRRKWSLGARVDILFLREMTVLCPDLSFSIDVQIQNTSLVPRLVPWFHLAQISYCKRWTRKAWERGIRNTPVHSGLYYCPSRGSWLKAWKRNSRTCIPPHLSGRWEHLHLLTGTSSITRVDPLLLQWCGYREERNFPFTASLIENQVDRVSKARLHSFSPFVWDVTDCVYKQWWSFDL